MARPRKAKPGGGGIDSRPPGMPAKMMNPRLSQQLRKVLGKHYANKYRTGRKPG